MGASDQPFMYEPPKKNPLQGFNPKAVTEASRRPPPKKAKADGPLVNFNQHPDSYLILPYGRTNAKSMSPKTADRIKLARWIQLAFRTFQLVGAIGLMIAVIFIRGTQDAEGWIIRIPPGADIIVSSYGVYHLIRPAKSRTPGSSASYHFFALVMDAGFIPFYAFIAIMANNKYRESWGQEGRWGTFFDTEDATDKVLLSTWLGSVTIGGLHLISLILCLYLVIMFRKIARLPPDMNPLEENLTSRRSTKHKHKNSEMTASTKRDSAMTVTTNGSARDSQAYDPLMPDTRTVPFVHTRKESDTSYSPHNPSSARQSRTDLENKMYAQPASQRVSRADTLHQGDDQPLSQRASYLQSQFGYSNAYGSGSTPSLAQSQRSQYQPISISEPVDITDGHKSMMYDNNGNDTYHRDSSPTDNGKRQSELVADNWFIHEEKKTYDPIRRFSFDSSSDESDNEDPFRHNFHQPLRMNPPTPVGGAAPRPKSVMVEKPVTPIHNRTRSTTSTPSQASPPKPRFYGDLKTATASLRPVSLVGAGSPVKPVVESINQGPERYGYDAVSNSPRVVSRTGVDEGDLGLVGYMGTGTIHNSGWRRREVSGKVVEEGRSIMMGKVR